VQGSSPSPAESFQSLAEPPFSASASAAVPAQRPINTSKSSNSVSGSNPVTDPAVSKSVGELENSEQPQSQHLSLESLDGLPLSVEDFDLLRDLTFVDFLSLIPLHGRNYDLAEELAAPVWDSMMIGLP